jgi:RHS repeat-associated protein
VTTDDPGGANRQTIETFEPSTSNSFLRRTGRQLPAGSGSNVTYDYYTATGGPIANVCGATGTTKQLGMLKRTTQADPDGAGPELPLIREYVYDSAGRQAGYRASTAVSSEPWTCTTYDAMGRVATVAYPAWNGQSARTVTYNYRVGSNPTVTSVGDSAGTITTSSDWAGRPISTVDVWAKTSTTTYDNLGRVATAVNSGGTLGYAYGTDNQITQITLNGKPIAQPAYDALTRPTGVSYPSGTSNAGNGSSGQFSYDDRGLPVGNAWTGPSSTPLTSDQVTRDLIGRVVNQATDGFDPNGATRNYVYAATGELTSAVNFAAAPAAAAATRTTTYTFAATGGCGAAGAAGKNTNRTAKTVNGGTPTTYCYDHADRLTATSEAATVESNTADGTLAYDQHGNTSVLGWQAMTYDIADRHLSTTAAELNNAASAVQVRTNNNRCLDVEGPSSADGAILQQWGCNSPAAAQQTWSLVAADGQWFNLVSQLSGKCMAPQGGGTADGTKFTQGACDQTAAAQQFRLAKSGSSWQLISRPTGKCVDVPSNVSSDGTDMQLLTCSSGAANSKLFTLTTTSGSATTPSTVRATAVSTVPAAGKTNLQLRARGNWKCADVRGPSSADGTVIQQWSCNTPAVSQQSIDIVDDGGSNQVKIKFRNANKCLQAQADHTVVQSTCVTSAANQRWTFTEVAGGWRLTTALNGRCLNSAPSGGDGTGLTMAACAGTPAAAELWSLTSPTNGSVVDLDADLPALPTVTYVRDATGRIIERKLNGTTEARYSFGGSGDSPTLMLNASNAVVGASISLPGGVLYQWVPSTPSASVWNYPNLQGSLTASANQAGSKVGATRVHDPDGNQVAGSETDTGPGQFDYGWLGQHQRPLEHQDGLFSVVQMGERQYSPTIGRFLEIDPLESGVANDYGYVADPVNSSDLSGRQATGGCIGVSVGMIFMLEANVCYWIDDRGRELYTYSWAGGFGADLSATVQYFWSNVKNVKDLRGGSGCASAGAVVVSLHGCIWKASGTTYGVWGIAVGPSAFPVSGSVTAGATGEMPSWMKSALGSRLKSLHDSVKNHRIIK